MDTQLIIPGNHSAIITSLQKNLQVLSSRRDNYAIQIKKLIEQKDKITPPKKTKYYLTGVIIHEGNVNYGHYYSYVKIGKDWFCFDDLRVNQVSLETVLIAGQGFGEKKSENCYCLVYAKGKFINNKTWVILNLVLVKYIQ